MAVVTEIPDSEMIHFVGFQPLDFHVVARQEVLSGTPGTLLQGVPLGEWLPRLEAFWAKK